MSEKVVIIGSGIGGLSAGYILQRNGYSVTVLEQNSQPGGCLQCYTRFGARFETGMHFIGSAAPGQSMDTLMKYLSISPDVKLSPLDPQGYNTIHLGDADFSFPVGRDAFLERMGGYFPKQKDALKKYLDIVDVVAAASTPEALLSSRSDMAAGTIYHTTAVNTVLDSVFSDELLKDVLTGDNPLYCAKRDRTPFSLHAFIMDFYNRSAFRLAGGSDSISNSLVKNIRALGGSVITGKKAVGIRCNSRCAEGVVCADGDWFPSDHVISAIHPARTLEMLDTDLIRPVFRNRISSLPQTPSIFTLNVRFKDCKVPYMNTNHFSYLKGSPLDCDEYKAENWPESFLYMHLCDEDSQRWAKCAEVLAYMNYDEVASWEGTRVGRRGADYEEFKREHAERLIDAVDRQFPGFREGILDYSCSTPLTYADYTGTLRGSMYGIAKDVTLAPACSVSCRTRIPNLYLAGQNVNSHGILGVLVGTLLVCSSLIPVQSLYKQIFPDR